MIRMEYQLHSCEFPLFVRVANNVFIRVNFKLWLIGPYMNARIECAQSAFPTIVYSVKSVQAPPPPQKEDKIKEVSYNDN